jgi:hypothetical protein
MGETHGGRIIVKTVREQVVEIENGKISDGRREPE